VERNGILVGVVAVLFAALVAGCGQDSEDADTTPPVAPVLKPRSLDSLYAETGIRPEPGTTPREYFIRIEWYRNREEDLAGYYVYRRGELATEFPQTPLDNLIVGQDISPYEDPHFIDYDTENLAPDEMTGETRGYYYAVQAYDQLGNVSDFSASAYYRLIANPQNLAVTSPSPGQHYLEWTYEGGPDVFYDYFMIRVWDEETGQRAWHMKYTAFGSTHSVALNANGTAEPFISGRRYVWKLSVIANSNPPDRSPAGCAVNTYFVYSD
jgi:hypothetical protein